MGLWRLSREKYGALEVKVRKNKGLWRLSRGKYGAMEDK